MASARYNCSKTMIRARWWGKVILPNVNYFKTLVDPMSKATVINNVFLIVASVVISMPILPKIKKFFYTSKKKEAIAVCITSVTNVVLLLLCIIMLTDSNNNPFLYFRF